MMTHKITFLELAVQLADSSTEDSVLLFVHLPHFFFILYIVLGRGLLSLVS